MLTSFDKDTMPAGAMAIYEANRAEVDQVRAQDAAVMSHKEHQDYEIPPTTGVLASSGAIAG